MYHILIIDNTPFNIIALTNILQSTYRISIATVNINAFDIIKEDPPDLILLDTVIPEMGGYTICNRLKSSEETEDIPMMFISATTEVEEVQKGFDMGAVDYISKPISSLCALARINNFFELKQMRDHIKELTEHSLKLRRKVKELEARDKMIRFHMQEPQAKHKNQMLSMPMARS